MAVSPRIVPFKPIVGVGAAGRGRSPAPAFYGLTGLPAPQTQISPPSARVGNGSHRHRQDAWNRARANLAVDLEGDRRLLDAEALAKQRREAPPSARPPAPPKMAPSASVCSIVGALVDVGGASPIAFTHRPVGRGANDQIQPVELYVAVCALVDVEQERDVTIAFRRPRCQGRRRLKTDRGKPRCSCRPRNSRRRDSISADRETRLPYAFPAIAAHPAVAWTPGPQISTKLRRIYGAAPTELSDRSCFRLASAPRA